MRRSSVRRTSDRRGVASAELAVLLPLLAFLFVIGADFARAFHYSMAVSNGARNGAMYAGRDPATAVNSAGITASALQDLSDLTPTPTVTHTPVQYDAAGFPYVDVTVKYKFRTITNFPGVPSPEITRTVRARVAPATPKPGTF